MSVKWGQFHEEHHSVENHQPAMQLANNAYLAVVDTVF